AAPRRSGAGANPLHHGESTRQTHAPAAYLKVSPPERVGASTGGRQVPLFGGRGQGRMWVFVHGRTPQSARDAEVEVVEAGRHAQALQGETGGGGYWWAEFPRLAHGEYTVRVRFPGGAT